jgi:MerR family transcriptional regulator, light-induced transcriptional regulator
MLEIARSMSAIRTNAAAAMLGVSPNTLRAWERRFGYPAPERTEGGHRQFELAQIEALRSAYDQTGEISSAIAIARERGAGPPSHYGLRSALSRFCAEKADLVLEESLSVRSLERTVESVLLAAVQSLGEDARDPSAEYCFAWRYATGWLAAAQRVAPQATRAEGVLVFDAAAPLELDALHVQALELFLRRASLRVLTLPVELQANRLRTALAALEPSVIVLAGSATTLDVIARLVYAARQSVGEADVLDYRGALPDTGASTVARLGATPTAALEGITRRLAGARAELPSIGIR